MCIPGFSAGVAPSLALSKTSTWWSPLSPLEVYLVQYQPRLPGPQSSKATPPQPTHPIPVLILFRLSIDQPPDDPRALAADLCGAVQCSAVHLSARESSASIPQVASTQPPAPWPRPPQTPPILSSSASPSPEQTSSTLPRYAPSTRSMPCPEPC